MRALIVGGGPAGAAAAIGLARGGVETVVIERDASPRDALCGGFLSWATIARLRSFGVEVATLGAHPVERLAVFAGGREAIVTLPAMAAGLSRGRLDTALLDAARAAGAGVRRGVAVRGIENGTAALDDGTAIGADHVILATGKNELRGHARPRAADGGTIGLRWRMRAGGRLAGLIGGSIELHLFRGGYAGLVAQEDGTANLCLAVDRARFARAERRPDALLDSIVAECPALAARLAVADDLAEPQAIANIPYGWRATGATPGLYRIGDQAAVIPSIAGEGIDIALASGAAVAAAVLAGHDPAAFQPALAARTRRPVGLAGAVWRTAERPAGALAIVGFARAAPWLVRRIALATRMA